MNPELLSRLQFALTISFHFIYPPISMGLGLLLVVIGVIYVRTKDPKWRQLSFFWVKVYGLVFAMGVATGLVQEFEFGTNWADYSRFVGNIFGSLLAAEGIFAFFLEGGFLGLMLFGGNRLGPRMWLLVILHRGLRRTLQRPVDHHGQLVDADAGRLRAAQTSIGTHGLHDQLQGGRLHAVVHPAHLAHLGGFVDGGRFVCAERRAPGTCCKGRHRRDWPRRRSRWRCRSSSCSASCRCPVFGANQAVEVTDNQPVKLAAMEGVWTRPVLRADVHRGLGEHGGPDDQGHQHPLPAQLPGLWQHQRHRPGPRIPSHRTPGRRSTWSSRSIT